MGKRIFYADYRNLDMGRFREEVLAIEQELVRQPPASVLLLVDVRGVSISPEILNAAKKVTIRTKPHVKKTAILGISGIRELILDLIVKVSGMTTVTFDEDGKAKDWLASA